MAEDEDVGVPVVGEDPLQPAQLRGAEGALVGAAGVGGVQADAEHVVGDAERVVLGAGGHVVGGVAVADGTEALVSGVEVGRQVLRDGVGGAGVVGGDGPHVPSCAA